MQLYNVIVWPSITKGSPNARSRRTFKEQKTTFFGFIFDISFAVQRNLTDIHEDVRMDLPLLTDLLRLIAVEPAETDPKWIG